MKSEWLSGLVFSWGVTSVARRALECAGACYALQGVLMPHPYQAGGLQRSHGAGCGLLAADDPGTGSGWRQSRQNWMPPAVGG